MRNTGEFRSAAFARARKALRSFLLVASVLSVGGCQWFLANTGPSSVVVRSQTIQLAWDSVDSPIADQPSSVDHHRVYYRSHGSLEWRFLHATRDARPATTIGEWELGYGSYEFAVQEVYRNGRRSELHASSDYAAWPPGGWYVIWQEP